ncbi:MAG: hypothetical protein QOH76_1947 [Thermoleophilaceae bacterium]|nr:hypothetical protein [Thermoleophilaceae bacterium]
MRPLKRWRYIGAYGPDVMACVGIARIGPLRQHFWAVCEPERPVVDRTTLGRGGVSIEGSRALVETGDVRIDLTVEEDGGVETRHPDRVWTRKQAGVPVRGSIRVEDRRYEIDCLGAVDDTEGRHRRHTTWTWSAGVGRGEGGERIGWNLVTGVNDSIEGSERYVWIDGEPRHLAPVEFADDLSSVTFGEGGGLDFTSWGSRDDRTNLLLLRSEYRQPFGTFAGTLPGGVELAEGYGVMEWHDVWW